MFLHSIPASRSGPGPRGSLQHGDRLSVGRWVFTLACLLAGAGMVQAAESGGGALTVSGFGTFGLVRASAPDGWGFRRSIAQPGNDGGTRVDVDSRLGLQLNYAPNAQFELVGQAVAMRRSVYAPASDAIEWAFAAYRPNPDLALRIGRVNLDSFLMSDYRNVGFAYAPIRPPVDFYGTLPASLDGADVAQVWDIDGTRWRAKAYVGRSHSGDLSEDSRVPVVPVLGVMVSREVDGLLLRTALTRSAVRRNAPALQPLIDGLQGVAALPLADVARQATTLRSYFDFQGAHAYYAALGLRYERHDWQLNAEYTRVSGHPGINFKAAWASVGRRFGPVTLYGIASRVDTPGLPVETPAWEATLAPLFGPAVARQTQALAAGAAHAANRTGANQRTLSVGARWDLQARVALKVQWDQVRIDANGSRLWARPSLDAARADVGSVALDFVF